MSSPTESAPPEKCAWSHCPEPAKYRHDGKGFCAWHYGPPNRTIGIEKHDEVIS